MRRKLLVVIGVCCALMVGVAAVLAQAPKPRGPQAALGTGFTYQGQLKQNNVPANGSFTFGFRLYDASGGGNEVGSPITQAILITEGLFTTNLDFGVGVFDGSARWLGITLTGGGSELVPRQAVSAVPYALHAADAWNLNGNAGTSANNLLGTRDGQTLTLAVSGTAALRLVPAYDTFGNYSPNVIGGSGTNMISGTLGGATIAGGANNMVGADDATVGGGAGNSAGAATATVGGGSFDSASGFRATVAGGGLNSASGPAATIGGGYSNTVAGQDATIGGGAFNSASGYRSTVGGGGPNSAADQFATVGGGTNNTASGAGATVGGGSINSASAQDATVGGGYNNSASGQNATVGGGFSNTVSLNGWDSTIGGGASNAASNFFTTIAGGISNTTSAADAAVGGGYNNSASAQNATVGGGTNNAASGQNATVGGGITNTASGQNATVPGGSQNVATGDESFAAGLRAKAVYTGTFVWADSTPADFVATNSNQFLIRASGFVGINTNNPKRDLTISSNSTFVTGIDLYNTSTATGTVGYRLQVNGSGVARPGNLELWGNQRLMTFQPDGKIGFGGVTTTSAELTLPNIAGPDGEGLAFAWSTYSSRRWKTDISTLSGALDKVERLRGVSYRWTSNGKPDIGLVAEEVGAVVPEVVTYETNGVDAQSVDYSRLVALLVQAIKEQQGQIDQQEQAIDALRQAAAPAPPDVQAQNAALAQRVDTLEARLTALEQAPSRPRGFLEPLGSSDGRLPWLVGLSVVMNVLFGGSLVVAVVVARRH